MIDKDHCKCGKVLKPNRKIKGKCPDCEVAE